MKLTVTLTLVWRRDKRTPGMGLGLEEESEFEWVRVLHVPELHAAVRPAATLWTVERNASGGDSVVAAIVLEKANPMERWPALAAGGTDGSGVIQDAGGMEEAVKEPELSPAQRRKLEEASRAATLGALTTEERANEAAIRKYAKEHPALDFGLVLDSFDNRGMAVDLM